jgi:hypothetical protein
MHPEYPYEYPEEPDSQIGYKPVSGHVRWSDVLGELALVFWCCLIVYLFLSQF